MMHPGQDFGVGATCWRSTTSYSIVLVCVCVGGLSHLGCKIGFMRWLKLMLQSTCNHILSIINGEKKKKNLPVGQIVFGSLIAMQIVLLFYSVTLMKTEWPLVYTITVSAFHDGINKSVCDQLVGFYDSVGGMKKKKREIFQAVTLIRDC